MWKASSGDAAIREQLVNEGYFQTTPTFSPQLMRSISDAIGKLVSEGLPPVFAFVYDEMWLRFAALSNLLESVLGPGFYAMPADIWAWHVEPDDRDGGWSPHRDLAETETLRADGSPLSLTVWIAFTNATTLNGCIYVLPTNRDANLATGFLQNELGYSELANVRALPVDAGSVLGWNSRLLHWGARSSAYADRPRISASIYFNSAHYADWQRQREFASGEALYFRPDFELNFERRLAAIVSAFQQYGGRVAGRYPWLERAVADGMALK